MSYIVFDKSHITEAPTHLVHNKKDSEFMKAGGAGGRGGGGGS